MKVIKENDLSILFKPWGYGGSRYYLHIGCILGFDLLSPQRLFTEQDLWGKLPQLMGDAPIIDEAMPKVRGEFLVTGKCHAPAGRKIPAGRAAAAIGGLEKQLHVFGDRRWRRNHAGIQVISDPEPFSEMALSYPNAFGGPDFKKNPLGKGFVKNEKDESGLRPLPNLELPGREIGSPKDTPEPACFAPLDRMWPQRFKRVGTYGEEWQNTRWPYFPADMDYEFFNMAPEDQRLDDFFSGDESFRLEGMHPEHPRIENTLPPVRPRQFVYKKIDREKGFEPENLLFEEVPLKLDTVWFFPEGLLGVLVFHGSAEILDEEYMDVHRLYLTREPAAEAPGTLEHYRDKMFKAMDMSVPMDMSPFEEAAPKFESMLRQWRNIPKKIEETKQRAMGKAPKMSYTPDETAAKLKKVIAESHPTVDRLENLAGNMHKKYGHLVRIDLTQFDAWRKRLGEMDQRVDEVSAKAADLSEQKKKAEEEAGRELKAQYSPEELEKAGIDPDNLLEQPPADPWRANAFSFVLQSRKNLENDAGALERLHALGFETNTMERTWMGVNPDPVRIDATLLGLDPQDLDENPVCIPPGLVLPVFDSAEPSRVAVRTGPDWTNPEDQFMLPGSRTDPVFMPACASDSPPVIAVAEQLTALLLEQEAGDACHVLWLPDTSADPGDAAAEALQNALRILAVTSCDDRLDAPSTDLLQWAAGMDNTERLTIPEERKTLFEAGDPELKIRPWILRALPEAFARAHDIGIGLPAEGEAPGKILPDNLLPPMDIQGLIEKALDEVNAFYQPKKDAMNLEMEKSLDQAAKDFDIPRSEVDAAMEKSKSSPPPSPKEMGQETITQLEAERDNLRYQNRLTPEADAKIQADIDEVEKIAGEAQDRNDRLYARLDASKKELEDKKAQLAAWQLPDEAAQSMREAGLDPDKMRSLTREEVIEIHGRGESLAGYNLSGLDLSGLDLSGADFSGAQCMETCFVQTLLTECNLSRVMANKADFSEADLTGAVAEMALLPETMMSGTIFRAVRFKQVAFKDAELCDTDFSDARLELVSFEGAAMDRASFADARLELSVFNGISGNAMHFARMHGYKSLFQKSDLNGADFSGAVLPSCMFMNSRGEDVVFFEADLSRASICQDSAFPGCDLRNAQMRESCFKDSDLSGADLRKARMDGTLFEGCDLSRACLRRAGAPRTKFKRVDMTGADMRGLNLLTGSLQRSRLVNADISSSNLYGVDFYKAAVGETNLEGSNLKLTLLADGREQYLKK